jgi:hypothetical protein
LFSQCLRNPIWWLLILLTLGLLVHNFWDIKRFLFILLASNLEDKIPPAQPFKNRGYFLFLYKPTNTHEGTNNVLSSISNRATIFKFLRFNLLKYVPHSVLCCLPTSSSKSFYSWCGNSKNHNSTSCEYLTMVLDS